jgi:hypothetical protein
MSPKFVITFSGRMGSGKTTCCNFLRDRHGATILNFADGLKYMVCEMYTVDIDTLNASKDIRWVTGLKLMPRMGAVITRMTGILSTHIDFNRVFHSYREVLQYIGTDLIRKHCPTWHIDNLAERAAEVTGSIAIGDARFPDELAFSKAVLGAHTVYLVRGTVATGGHSSETSITPEMCDVVIENNGTAGDLCGSIQIHG